MNYLQKIFKSDKIPKKSHSGSVSLGGIFGQRTSKMSDLDLAFSSYSFACINMRSKAVASLNYSVFYDYKGEPELVEDDHWMNRLINKPNPNISWRGLLKLVQMWLDYNGNAYIYAPTNGMEYPTQMFVLQSDNVNMKIDREGEIKYEYSYGGTRYIYYPDEIIHIKTLEPGISDLDDYLGKAIFQKAKDLIMADIELNQYLYRYFTNDTIPPYILKSPVELEDDQIQHFVKNWNNKLPNHKMMGALSGGMDAMPLALNSTTSIGVEGSDRLLLEKIAIIYGIPIQKLKGEATSLASAEITDFTFRMDTIEPLAFLITDTITQFLKTFDSYLKLDFEEFNYQDADAKMRLEAQDINLGIRTINEIRIARGLDTVEWGDKPSFIATQDTI